MKTGIGEQMKNRIKKALELHLESHIQKHVVNIELLLDRAVGVAEHSDIMGTIEKELEEVSNYHDKLEALRKYF